MKAAVYYGAGDIRVEERPEPEPREDNLIADVRCCAICGTDVKLSTIGHPRWKPPVIIGHEFCGSLIHVGSDVSGFCVGDRVTMATTLACNRCPTCSRGLQNMCPNAKPISMVYDGAFATRISIPHLAAEGGNVVKLPDEVSDEEAAMAEPLSCAANAQELAGLREGDRVLIIGGGPLGALHAELAKAAGAAKILIVQRSEPRLSLLRKLRDIIVVDGAHEDVGARVAAETASEGADVVVVSAPSRSAQEQAPEYARKGGSISLFASLAKDEAAISLDSRTIHYGELRIVGASDSRPEHVRNIVELMSKGRIELDKVVTHRITLDQIHEGFELMKRKQSLKVMVYPGETVS